MNSDYLAPLPPESLEDALGTVHTTRARASHLVVKDPAVCLVCPQRECISSCPAGTYAWEREQRRLAVSYENCLECGTCRVSCPFGNIAWSHPDGGFGVSFRYG